MARRGKRRIEMVIIGKRGMEEVVNSVKEYEKTMNFTKEQEVAFEEFIKKLLKWTIDTVADAHGIIKII